MKLIIAITAIWIAIGISGCETVKGFGQDLTNAGEALKKKAAE